MNIYIPEAVVNRLKWCERMQEKLRLLGKYMFNWYKEGINENVYNQFPVRIKNAFPYTSGTLSLDDYNLFRNKLEKFEMALWVVKGPEKILAANSTDEIEPDIDVDII